MKSTSPEPGDIYMENQQLKKGLTLAEKRLTEISKLSFDLIRKSKNSDLDIYNKAYKINQCAHDAIGPIRKYCIDDPSNDS